MMAQRRGVSHHAAWHSERLRDANENAAVASPKINSIDRKP